MGPIMIISLIAAVGTNRAIGRGNALLWHLPGDLPRFKEITTGHPVVMGRKTYDSIGGPLPGRLNIVMTRKHSFAADGTITVHDLDEALTVAAGDDTPNDEVFIIGGGTIYTQTIDRADKLYLTEVDDAPADADTFFPDYSAFSNVLSCEHRTGSGLTYRFTVRTRNR